MSRTVKPLGILVLAGWCLGTSTLAAQAPVQTIAPAQPVTPAAAATANVVVTDGPAPLPAPVSDRPFQRCLNKHGLGCASDFNQFGCGNLCSELTFIFGSCRTFFGQPCYPNPAHFGPDGTRSAGRQKCCGN